MRGRFNGGYIGAQQVTTYGNTKGVYNMVEVQQYVGNTQWPRPPDDFYFNYVVALLHGNGGNPLTSGTPDIVPINKDNSTNNFLLSPNGDVRNDEFHPYQEGYYSNYFDGSGDYLTAASNAAFSFSTGDFTIECWVNFNITTVDKALVSRYSASTGWNFRYDSNGIALFNGDTNLISKSFTPTVGLWYHLAVARQGTSLRLFINGVLENTVTNSTSLDNSNTLYIGRLTAATAWELNGYLSNVRIVKGTAVYTSNFTPSTTPLTAVSGTSLLTCQSNRLIDNSTNRFALTKNGDVSVQYFQPFGQSALNTATYTNNQPSPGTNGYHSVYFDGTGDWLTISNTTALDLPADFTIEAWINCTSTENRDHEIIAKWDATPAYAWNLAANPSTGLITLGYGNSGTYVAGATFASSFAANAWFHIAITRSGSTVRAFLNGTQAGSNQTITSNLSATATTYIGRDDGTTRNFIGYLSNIRVVKGTALYTSNFTPSTTPLTAIANTSLLTCQSNTLVDNSTNNFAITANGDARVSVAQPFTSTVAGSTVNSYGSMYFDGNGDFLTCNASSALNLTSGDFTIECWIYCPSFVQTSGQIFNKDGVINASYVQYSLQVSNAGALTYYLGNGNGLSPTTTSYSGGTITAGVWFHTAITRTGTTIRTFLNGTQITSTTQGTAMSEGNKPLYIGFSNSGPTSDYFSGYINNLRILKGTSLYQANFIPPNMPVTPVTNTSLLTFQNNGPFNNNGFEDGGPFDHIVSRSGDISQGSFSPYGTNWSNYFDGSGDWLSLANNNALNLSGGDFTIEAWVQLTALPALSSSNFRTTSIVTYGSTTTNEGYEFLLDLSNNTIIMGSIGTSNSAVASFTFALNTWYHVAVSRSGATDRLFVNGQSLTLTTNTFPNNSSASGTLRIGAARLFAGYNFDFPGYISNLRIVKGAAVYTSSFTPSTTPLTAIANTSLLTCQSNRFVDNSTNNFTITQNGDVSVHRFSPFIPSSVYNAATYGGSTYFNGSTDSLILPSSPAFSLPTSTTPFTIEAWVYPVAAGSCIFTESFTGAGDTIPITISLSADGTGPSNPTGRFVSIGWYTGSAWVGAAGANTTLNLNEWTHIACVFTGTTTKIYYNGVDVTKSSSPTPATSWGVVGDNGDSWYVGRRWDASGNVFFSGFISDFRFVRGSAVYTAPFTPPSSPLTSIANTSALLSMTNTGIYDNSMLNNFTSVGNVQSTSRLSKYGTGSLYFDGTGDYLYANPPVSPLFAFGSGDFTVEFWYNSNDNGVAQAIYDGRPTNTNGAYLHIYKAATNVMVVYVQTADRITGTTTISAGTWYHVAVCRSGSSTKLFVNGVQDGSTYTDTNSYLNGSFRPLIASNGFTVGTAIANAYIDDLRVTRFARYTANFQPPLYQYNDR